MRQRSKGGISDGALTVTYYSSWGIVSCNFIFHVANSTFLPPPAQMANVLDETEGGIPRCP